MRIGQPVALDRLASALNIKALGVWERLRGLRRFPSRLDITPRDFAGLLRNIALVKILDAGHDYEYRLAGDAHVEAQGFAFLGKRVSDIDRIAPGYAAALRSSFDCVRESGVPLALKGWLKRPPAYIHHESLFLPFGQDPPVVDHLLLVSSYGRKPSVGSGAPASRYP